MDHPLFINLIRRRSLVMSAGLALFLAGCLAFREITPTPPSETTANWFTVYFSDPDSPQADLKIGGPDEALAAAIDQAQFSVDMAAYELGLWTLRDALLSAHERGVTVRLVVESDNRDEPEIQELDDGGIPVLGDRREGLMHNKFVIIDRLEVWTGSMNFTVNGTYKNDNNLIRVRSSRLAENYLAEFEEMFEDDHFGPTSPANTPNPSIIVSGSRLETYFSSEDGTADRLLELIDSARQSIYFMAFSFTSDDLAEAMLNRAADHVTVAGVMEEAQYNSNVGTEFDNFRANGLDVRLDGNRSNMHHKVMIIDQQIVVTGSYNFSASAEERNDENTLIIHNAAIAALYMQEFNRVFSIAQK